MQDLNDLIPADSGIVLEAATAINDDGIIVGIATAVDGHVRHAVVLKPHGS
jgi:probable HAF family extracellular repeat protein